LWGQLLETLRERKAPFGGAKAWPEAVETMQVVQQSKVLTDERQRMLKLRRHGLDNWALGPYGVNFCVVHDASNFHYAVYLALDIMGVEGV
jgi:hypothetical protein